MALAGACATIFLENQMNSARNTILVTGANGLLGGGLVRRLIACGRAVVAMDRSEPPEALSWAEFVKADINDIDRLTRALSANRVDCLVHCGAVSGRVVAATPRDLLDINVRGTATVAEAARKAAVRRIVFCSSAAAYGNAVPEPLTESAPLNPTTLYGASKVCGEAILRAYAAEYALDVVALRIFQVFGPRRTTECYIRLMIENAFADRRTIIPQAASSRRQYVYVDDVVDALFLAATSAQRQHTAYHVAGDSSLTLAEIAAIVADVVPGVDVEFGVDSFGGQYTIGTVDLSLAQAELGYRPKVSLRDGIRRYADWLRPAAAAS
jgi:nucleoside-diphosphate-sugar epimerase